MPLQSDLNVKVNVNDAQLDSGLKDAEKKVENAAKKMGKSTSDAADKAATKAGGSFTRFKGKIKGAETAVSKITASVGAWMGALGLVTVVIAVIVRAINSHRKAQEELNKATEENHKQHLALIEVYDQAAKKGIELTQSQLDYAAALKGAAALERGARLKALEGLRKEQEATVQTLKDQAEELDTITGKSGKFFKERRHNLKASLKDLNAEHLALAEINAEIDAVRLGYAGAADMAQKQAAEATELAVAEAERLRTEQEMQDLRERQREEARQRRIANVQQEALELAQIQDGIAAQAQENSVAIGSFFEQAVGGVIASGKSGAEAWSEFMVGSARMLVSMLGEELIQKGTAKLAEGLAALLNPLEAPFSAGFFAQGAALAAAGGSIKAAASTIALAEGAIITRPTLAIVGEGKEPEGVFPLSRAAEFGFGGGGGATTIDKISMNFPAVRRESDLRGPRFGETAARELASVMQRLREREGRT